MCASMLCVFMGELHVTYIPKQELFKVNIYWVIYHGACRLPTPSPPQPRIPPIPKSFSIDANLHFNNSLLNNSFFKPCHIYRVYVCGAQKISN